MADPRKPTLAPGTPDSDELREYTEQYKKWAESVEATKDGIEDLGDAQEELAAKIKYFREMQAAGKPLKDAELDQLKAYRRSLREVKDALDELNESYTSAGSHAKGLAGQFKNLLGITSDYNKTLSSQISTVMSSKKGMKKFFEEMKKGQPVASAIHSLYAKVQESTLQLIVAQDSALVSFNRATGAGRKYSDEIVQLEQSMYHAGITIEDSAASFQALQQNFYGLRNTSESTRGDMTKTVAILGEMGVNMETSAKNIQIMTAALGFSRKEAAATQRELFALAQTIDMPPDQMAQAFGEAMPKLAAFGRESTEVFKKLQVNARAAGMEVSQILSVVEQFDKFDTAAAAVGRLNALLGGPFLNSLEMVTVTDPTERMRMLSEAVANAGQSFDTMTHYQRKAIASAMGLQDVNQLALVMKGRFKLAGVGVQKSAAEIEKLAEQTQEFNTIAEEFTEVIRMFAVQMAPLIDILKDFINGITWLNKTAPGLIKHFPFLILGLKGVSMAMKMVNLETKKMGGFGGFVGLALLLWYIIAITDWSPGLKAVLISVATALTLVSVAIWLVNSSLVAFNVLTGGIVPLLGLLFSALAGVAYFIYHSAGSPSFIAMIGLLGMALVALVPALIPVAIAIAGIAGSIWLLSQAWHAFMDDGDKSVGVDAKINRTETTTSKKIEAKSKSQKSGAMTEERIDKANESSIAAQKNAAAMKKETLDVNLKLELDNTENVKMAIKAAQAVVARDGELKKINVNVIANNVRAGVV